MVTRKIFDCFLYDGEADCLDLRFSEQKDGVDVYLVFESSWSFTGKPKGLRFMRDAEERGWDLSRLRYFDVSELGFIADDAWATEALQRNYAHHTGDLLDDDDLFVYSDADEVISFAALQDLRKININMLPMGCALATSYLFLNYRLVQPTWVVESTWSIVLSKSLLRETTLFEWRFGAMAGRVPVKIMKNAGWHFSYLMNAEEVRGKLRKFSHTEFAYAADMDFDYMSIVNTGSDPLMRDGYKFEIVTPTLLPLAVLENSDRWSHHLLEFKAEAH